MKTSAPHPGTVPYVRWYVCAAAIALLSSTMLCSTASATQTDQSGFSAIQGVNSETLSVEEMQAISGELNAYDIAAFLTAQAPKLAKYPKLQAADLKWADWYRTNAVAINKAFQKYGLLTPCKSCQ